MSETQANYKDTLNLPQTDFPMKANLPQREPQSLARWEEGRLHEKITAARHDAPLFVLHDGPPFANGDVHIGTALNKILKDVIVKYKTMRGFRVPYVPGWDCHGQPIEYKVTKELGDKAKAISQTELRKRCRAYAEKYIDVQRQQFKRLGVFGDWEHPYLTMTPSYEAEIIGALADMVGDGYIYRGKKPVYWCATCRTALAEAEVEYADHVSPSVYVKFPVKGRKNEFAVIWTTTPWTLPANLAIAVKPELGYVRARTNGETWILAEGLVAQVAQACGVEFEIVEKMPGRALEGLVTRHPFMDRDSPIVFSPYVTLEQGTGLVHTAPGHGAEDYEIGQKYGLETLAPVDDGGVFTAEAGPFAGQFVFKANKSIVEHLRKIGVLAASADVKHSYPHCWRCKNPIIFRAMEQWFIALDHRGLRQSALDEVKNVRWVPAWGQNRISGTIEQRPDWCISRQRAWGVPLPFLQCRDCQKPILRRDLILKFRERVVRDGVDIWFEQSVKELFGDVKCPHCGSTNLDKSPDIVDVWFESGVSHRAVLKTNAQLAYPADIYLEGSDQHRGWFQSSLLTAMATDGKSPFKTVVTHGFLVVQVAETNKKQKISKSAGKPANSEDYVKRFGADVLRLWVVSEDYQADIPLSEEIFARIGETYFKIRNTLRILLANLHDFDPAKNTVPREKLTEIDRWLLSRLQALVAELTEAYENFEFHRVYHLVNAFCAVELSSFYVDVMKDPLYTLAPDSAARRSAQTAMYHTVATLAKLIAPAMPFTADEVWSFLPGRETESVHLASYPVADAKWRDAELEARWDRLMEVRRVAALELEKARQAGQIGKSLEARVEIEPENDPARELLEKLGPLLETVLIVSQVRVGRPTGGELRVRVTRAAGRKCVRCWRWTEDVGVDAAHPALCGRCAEVMKQRDTVAKG
ncbi:MAG TPA: isoleucine--tRNA ligase [Verrucomicrobiae bacterium]|nr:isoleucine--tRNA ligase [Verrucomicrobiae bacterium]